MWEVARIVAAVAEASDAGVCPEYHGNERHNFLLLRPSCILYLQSLDYITTQATNKTYKI